MQIIKNHQITTDNWIYVEDHTEIRDGDVTVSLTRLLKNDPELTSHKGKLGVRVLPSNTIENIAEHLAKLALIELYFPELADGRLFSHAWLLRNRYHYQGEIRAAGHFLAEQVFYLSRVGVNSFAPEKAEELPVTLASLKDFSVHYQTSVN